MTGSGEWGKGKTMSLFENTSNLLNMPKSEASLFFQNYSSGKKELLDINFSFRSFHIMGYCLNVYILNKSFWGKTNNYLDYCWV